MQTLSDLPRDSPKAPRGNADGLPMAKQQEAGTLASTVDAHSLAYGGLQSHGSRQENTWHGNADNRASAKRGSNQSTASDVAAETHEPNPTSHPPYDRLARYGDMEDDDDDDDAGERDGRQEEHEDDSDDRHVSMAALAGSESGRGLAEEDDEDGPGTQPFPHPHDAHEMDGEDGEMEGEEGEEVEGEGNAEGEADVGGDPSKPAWLREYDVLGKIGEGTYGLVYLARNKGRARGSGRTALKKFKQAKEGEGVSPTAIREIMVRGRQGRRGTGKQGGVRL